ncbi:helix-turn-helix domain-containing protein [Microbacterium sp. SORGH_AS_0888]|uniref:helix-turn-helix domain-containing protein n=1 Tax=Microbacterium sp. SORGH_AS_0888 TaxID=3041791 RepID=UPI002789DE7D|nr:helix-turn-helix domain-containing protein [Microbacterium sp. SORGH_AS_0888]MDQ1130675.1 hypothetical protein [Microbacterium sp. SORGH_AS_0888]
MKSTDGFVMLPNWLIDDSDLTLHELAIYIVLLRFRNPQTGKWTVGMTTIADRARVSRETVKRTIPKLEQRGFISVRRAKHEGRNEVNEYTVAVPSRTAPEDMWARTARGQRIPKRKSRHSECLPADAETNSRHSETPGRHSQTPGVGTPSATKKTTLQKINTSDLTSALKSGPEDVSFDLPDDSATEKQVTLLRDLAICITWHIPNDEMIARWRKLTKKQASEQIRQYLKNVGMAGNWDGPDEGTPLFDELSQATKDWYFNGAVPAHLEWDAAA